MTPADPLLGRPDRSAWREYQIKGNLLAARARYIRETWGEDAVAEVASRLTPDLRAVFDAPLLPFAWYPLSAMTAIDRFVVDGPMKGQVAQMKHFGSTIARYDLPTLYKVLFKLGSPSFILGRMGTVYTTYVRGGAMRTVAAEKGSARVALVEGDLPYYFCDQGASGWIVAAIELSGGTGVDAVHDRCVHRGDARCEWRCAWQ
ncbi:MAG: hypothetical protein ACRENE_10950 [Polyangiaceae bacterium]